MDEVSSVRADTPDDNTKHTESTGYRGEYDIIGALIGGGSELAQNDYEAREGGLVVGGLVVGAESGYTGGLTKYANDHNKPALKDGVISKLMPEHVPECLGSVVSGHCISTKTLEKIDNLLRSGAIDSNGTTGLKDTSGTKWKVLGDAEGDETTSATSTTLAKSAKSPRVHSSPHVQIVEKAKEKLGCDTEICILEALEPHLGKALITDEITTNFKVKGPTDNKLLSNINIDNVMNKYSVLFPGFFPYNFNMRNYASYRFRKGYVERVPDTLATMQFVDLFANGYNCCGCVINDDTYQGPGTHWMALFADARGGKWSVEFFNSSGNAPAPEWVNWMTKTKSQMEDIIDSLKSNSALKLEGQTGQTGQAVQASTTVAADIMPKNPRSKIITTREEARKFCCEWSKSKPPQRVDIVCCSEIRHQQSKTECGLYSLFYVFARLNGVPYDYFMKNPVPDQLMFEFRQLLFNSEKGVSGGKFNWDQYRGQVSVTWE
jgi:hypothetical protein